MSTPLWSLLSVCAVLASGGICESLEDDVEPEISNETQWLSWISYGAIIGSNSSITLSKKDFNEECYLTRGDETIKLQDVDIEGVEVFPESTPFVSCRVVLGPMEEELLGVWTLCGRHEEDGEIKERCQPTVIFWALRDPSEDWNWRSLETFNHPVHYGGRVNPVVRGSGTLNTCHVVTPLGEDIVLTATSDYPGLTRIVLRDLTICSVNIGEVSQDFIGTWSVYGTYNSTILFNIVNQPMTFFLYDEQNPYEQAYNVTSLEKAVEIVNEGNIITVNITGSGTRVECVLETNKGMRVDSLTVSEVEGVSFVNNNNAICRFQIGPITRDMFGEWMLRGRFRRNVQMNNEIILPFIIEEEGMVLSDLDPHNPAVDETREVVNLDGQDVYTRFGASHQLQIALGRYQASESCHLRVPDGRQFILAQGFSYPGVTIDIRSGVACGITIKILDEEVIGDWTLIARINGRYGLRVENRLPFAIHVEDYVTALPAMTTIAEGNDLFMRLENTPRIPNSCGLEGPTRSTGEVDPNFADFCGFIVRDITNEDNGRWNITYGTRIKFKAFVEVTVTPRDHVVEQKVRWTKDRPVNQMLGPEDAIFCHLQNPRGLTVFEGFGRCNVLLQRVTEHDQGIWTMIVGTEGRVLTETHKFLVEIDSKEPKAEVTTSVVAQKPDVMMACHVANDEPVTACKFRDPSGRVLLASQGVGEDRYTFHGVSVSMESNASDTQCGLRITNPVVSDLGLWRCAVETEADIYYGFLTVLCPFAMQIPEVAIQVVEEPILETSTELVSAVEGDDVTMSCSINSAIRYCYFRRQNGTVFSVSPGSSGDFEYAGAGLDAGECGIRFPSLLATDAGGWSCHVGFFNYSFAEQRANFDVAIEPLMRAEQEHIANAAQTLVVSAQVHSQRTLHYCRFVRMDGLGFTSENPPANVVDHSNLNTGWCEIRIDHPDILERHPWTIAALIRGQTVEIVRSTLHTLEMPGPQPGPAPGTNFMILWTVILVSALLLFFGGLMCGSKKNRRWTYRRAAAIRDSIRRSLHKEPIGPEVTNDANANGTPTRNQPTLPIA